MAVTPSGLSMLPNALISSLSTPKRSDNSSTEEVSANGNEIALEFGFKQDSSVCNGQNNLEGNFQWYHRM